MLKDKRAVFGLTAVQAFFAIILGIALLAYVIVIIMGTLDETTLLSQLSGSVSNEVAYANSSGYTISKASLDGFGGAILTGASNRTSGTAIGLGNLTLTSAGVLTNATSVVWTNLSISYTYDYNSPQQSNLNSILEETSTGVTGFFSAINPVYAILAVLVIILILVVLVRVVQAPSRQSIPQL